MADLATQETGKRLGPNDKQPCGTRAARVNHLAHGKPCPDRICWPSGLPNPPVPR